MAKNKRKAKQAAARHAAKAAASRRGFLRTVGFAGVGALACAGAGWAAVSYYGDLKEEHDLTKVGNGVPAVVQIHDPQCALCASLQRETREAMADFADDELQFVIANVAVTSGRNFADRFRVGSVTLLLFDGDGRMLEAVQGVRDSEELKGAFTALIAASKE